MKSQFKAISRKVNFDTGRKQQHSHTMQKAENMDYSQVDLDALHFTEMREMSTTRKGSYQCYVNQSKTSRCCPRFQCPVMALPFGIELFDGATLESEVAKGSKLKVKANVDDPEFAAFLEKLDRFIVETAKIKKSEWFPGKNYSDERIEALYKPKLTQDAERKYAPRLTIKITTKDTKNRTALFCRRGDNTWNDATFTDLNEKGVRATFIVELKGIWSSAVGFGIDIDAEKILIEPRKRKALEFDFITPVPMRRATDAELAMDLDYPEPTGAPPDEACIDNHDAAEYREFEVASAANDAMMT